jgi:multiple sugar transport system permease protein
VKGARARRALRMAVVGVILAVLLFPIYWLILTSTNTPDRILSRDPHSLLPRRPSLEAYRYVLGDSHFVMFARNSLIVAGSVTLFGVSVSALGAYALARLAFPGRRLVGRLVLFAYVVPPVLLVVPMFVALARLGLIDTPIALVLAHTTFAIPFCMWILRGFFLSLPASLEEAALVDGCTRLQAFRRVVLPLARPGLVAAAMFAFLLSWNEYLYALVFMQSDAQKTLPIGIQTTYFNVTMAPADWLHLLTASVLASIPVFLLFMGLQRWMVSGLTAGAVKG